TIHAPHSIRAHVHPYIITPTPTTHIHTLSLHDALPILSQHVQLHVQPAHVHVPQRLADELDGIRDALHVEERREPRLRRVRAGRSEEHTSELQSHLNLVCRLLLEKKKHIQTEKSHHIYV